MIVKIQRPLSTNADIPEALIYNKSRTVMYQIPYVEVQQLFNGTLGELKVYHEAEVINKILHINERVEDQDW